MTAVSDDMVTVAEASKILGRSIEQVRRYLREGKLPGQRIGGPWFIERDALKSLGEERSIFQRRMELLKDVRELRQQIFAHTGQLFSGAELVEESRAGRDAELKNHLS